MKFRLNIIALVTVATAAIVSMYEKPAMAFTITRNNNGKELFEKFLQGNTTGLSDFKVKLTGDGRAFGVFQDDPFGLTSGIVLSTGRVIDIVGQNTVDGGFAPASSPPFPNDLSSDFATPGSSGDSISMQIDFQADNTVDNLYFQYVFGSEEFVEYGGQFNDSFSLTLNGENLATLSDNAETNINNLVPSPFGPYHPDFIYNPVGTGPASTQTKLDGYTKPLTFAGKLNKNAKNTLVINVQDTSDGIFDSAVFIKAKTFGTVPPPPIGNGGSASVPESSSGLGILASALGAGLLLKRKQQQKGSDNSFN